MSNKPSEILGKTFAHEAQAQAWYKDQLNKDTSANNRDTSANNRDTSVNNRDTSVNNRDTLKDSMETLTAYEKRPWLKKQE